VREAKLGLHQPLDSHPDDGHFLLGLSGGFWVPRSPSETCAVNVIAKSLPPAWNWGSVPLLLRRY